MCRPHGKYGYTYGVLSLYERGSRILPLLTFIKLARCRYDDCLSAAHIAELHKHEVSALAYRSLPG